MTLRTAFTEFLSVRHPVALAPMGDVAGGALAAAVPTAAVSACSAAAEEIKAG
jgi:nitronate monooxygenase